MVFFIEQAPRLSSCRLFSGFFDDNGGRKNRKKVVFETKRSTEFLFFTATGADIIKTLRLSYLNIQRDVYSLDFLVINVGLDIVAPD